MPRFSQATRRIRLARVEPPDYDSQMSLERRGLLVAVVLASFGAGCTKGSTATTTSSASPPATSSAQAVPSIQGVKAAQPSNWSADPKKWSVSLTWDQPAPPFVVHHYVVSRDGKIIAGDLTATKYVDPDVEPASKYHYSVIGVDASGSETDPGAVAVQTQAPPLEDARMDGHFVVKFHITSQGNLQSGASGFPELFTLTPKCGSGACDVSLSLKKVSGSTVLSRSGTSYDGTLHAPFFLQSCQGGSVVETLVFHLRALAAGAVHGDWRVTKFDGTMDETASASGCLTGHLAYSLSGIVQA